MKNESAVSLLQSLFLETRTEIKIKQESKSVDDRVA